MFNIYDRKTDIDHFYQIGFATPLEWLNDMFNAYGEEGDYDDLDCALTFAQELGTDFLNFCDKENKKSC